MARRYIWSGNCQCTIQWYLSPDIYFQYFLIYHQLYHQRLAESSCILARLPSRWPVDCDIHMIRTASRYHLELPMNDVCILLCSSLFLCIYPFKKVFIIVPKFLYDLLLEAHKTIIAELSTNICKQCMHIYMESLSLQQANHAQLYVVIQRPVKGNKYIVHIYR